MQHLPFLLQTCSYPKPNAQMLNYVKASKYTSKETRDITAVLNYELDKWKNRLPQEFRSGHVTKTTKNLLLWHVVMLHFLYHNCVMMVNRFRDSSKSAVDKFPKEVEPNTTDPQIYISITSRIAAARSTISLLKQIPKENQIRIWWAPVAVFTVPWNLLIIS